MRVASVTPPLLFLSATVLAAPISAQDVPLFASDEVLQFTVVAPLEDIFDHRDQESEEYPGIIIVDAGTHLDTVEVDIRTRGRSRLDNSICRFPPLRLDFPKSRVGGTVFEGQDKVKLVTHCRDDDRYEQDVIKEALAYRFFNELTDVSFRVRVARITYEDTSSDDDPRTRHGFLIEPEEAVAERTGWSYIATPNVAPDYSDPEHLALLEMFQYMIGNADFSAFSADPGSDECCHNTKPIGEFSGPIFALPYDFDITGFVDTRYADRLFRGNLQRLGVRDIRDRRFRGLCQSEEHWDAVLQLMVDRRDAIEGVIRDQEGLEPDTRDEALEYIGEFFEMLQDPDRARETFLDECIPT
jgi:hypothetical protein